jgi:hypothetical protein
MEPAMRQSVVLAALLAVAPPAWALEGRYQGEAKFVVGNRHCPTLGPSLNFEIRADGKVVGGVKTATRAVSFDGTIGPDGKLNATYKGDSDTVTIEAVVNDRQLEGFTQSPGCRYKLSFERQ